MIDEEINYSSRIGKNDWYSVTSVTNEADQSYCEYCFAMFKSYREIINGICQSCGKPPIQIRKNKQEQPKLTAINAKIDGDSLSGVSLEIDSRNAILQDDTTLGYLGDGLHMSASSLTEALDKLRRAEKSTGNTVMVNSQYEIKTTYKKKETEIDPQRNTQG